jgi:ATP/maltotriose-dependent transcriptional regulator MalT
LAGRRQAVLTPSVSADGAASTLPPLVETKFAQPRQRSGTVPRARLHRAFEAADGAALTLLAAPTGYGKTTAVRAWCESEERPVAWVTLDAGDNDPVRLWTYVASAIDRIRDGLGRPALQRLRLAGVSLESVVDELVNGITSYSAPMVLVLDDLQAVVDPACMASIEYAVERMPANARLLAITRIDPAIRLARMRGRGGLAELRVAELAFTVSEARELLVEREGLALTDADVAALVEHTEGWPAGLYLAALWLRSLDDPSSGVREFAGHQRQVAEYLGSEVLDALDSDVRSFLMRSAVLGRFTAELCDAVLGRTDSASMLAELEHSNLFLVPLDGRGTWFRYHALFSELLELQLAGIEPAAELEIHRRASAWFRERGLFVESAEHAAAGQDHGRVAELLAENHLILLRSGLSATLLRWIGNLPEEQLLEYPILPVVAAVAAGLTGRPAVERRRFLAIGERAKAEHPERLTPYHEAAAEMTRAVWMDGDVAEAIRHGRRAEALAGKGAGEIYVAAVAGLAGALYFAGEIEEAAEAAQRAVRHSDAERQNLGRVEALSILALVAAESGRLTAARSHADEARKVARDSGLLRSWVGGTVSLAQAMVLAGEGKLREAEQEAEYAVQIRRALETSVAHAWALILLASIRARRGRLRQAEKTLDVARDMLAELPDPGRLPAMADEVATFLAQTRAEADGGPVRDPLSPAELEILRLLATDLSQREIGMTLYLSLNTVKTHTRSVYRKLRVSSREAANARAAALGLLDASATSNPVG